MKNWRTTLQGSEFKIMRLNDAPASEQHLESPDQIYDYLVPKLAQSIIYRRDVENFIIVHLNTRHNPIGFEIISTGTLDTLLVHAREVFKSAIVANSAAIILAHNHPSGDPTPSEADIKVTRDLIRAGQLLKIEVLDHVILGVASVRRPKAWSSLREQGFFYS
jgi:DNA repair protein RadC